MITLGSWRRGAAAIVLSVSLVGGVAGATQASEWPGKVSLEDAIRAFDDAALRIDTTPASELARWTRPILLAIDHQAGMASIAPQVEAAVRSMAAIAGVPVSRVAWGDARANFLVRASNGELGRPPCRSTVDWSDDGDMLRADIHVNLANPARITRCINHEVLHGFGFRGHAHNALSVLSYRHAAQAELTHTDHLMLQTLYDPRLKPGTRAAVASATACAILAEKMQASMEQAAVVCSERGHGPRRLVAFAGSRATQATPHPTGLQPGYRDDGR